MAMNALRRGASGGIGKFILLGLLVLAGGGLVLTDAGGFFRNGVGSNDIAKIKGDSLSIQKFDRSLRRALAPLNIGVEQATQMGYTRQILNNEVRTMMMEKAAHDYGIQISRPMIAKEIHTMLIPMVQDGQNVDDVLNQVLASQGISEGDLVDSINRDMSVNILGQTLQAGFATPSDAIANDLAAYMNESRTLKYIYLADSSIKNIPAPTEEQLNELYSATKENYAVPESRAGHVIIISNDDLRETLEISEDDIRAEYERNIDSFTLPETRSVSQSILRSQEQAEDVAKAVKDGKSLKEAVKAATGGTTDFIPAQLMNKDSILEDLREPVFAAKKGDIIGPIETALGFQVLKLEDLKKAKTLTLEEATIDIRNELTDLRMSDLKYDTANTVDDLLASGMSPEEVKSEIPVTIIEIPAIKVSGELADTEASFPKNLESEKPSVLQALYELEEGQSSPVYEMPNGDMAAVFLNKINTKSFRPMEEIKSELEANWIKDQQQSKNAARVEKLIKDNADFTSIAKASGLSTKTAKNIKRDAQPPKPFTPVAISTIFDTAPAEMAVVDLPEGTAVIKVTGYNIGDIKPENLEQVKTTLQETVSNEAMATYFFYLGNKYNARINDRLLQRAYMTLQ
ncbi:MAG: peptidylprolyl isomerase [Micavibrio sp.]|nr:peptidylprolyl isomerase [Micavibrio sp.]